MRDRGALYVAIGAKHAREAIMSARSLREHMPQLPIAIVTDQDVIQAQFDLVIPPFSETTKRQKMLALANSPFAETLFLDTDTLVLAPVAELFELLPTFDAALALSPWHATVFPNRHDCPGLARSVPDVPNSYPTWNTGVIVAGCSRQWQRTVTTWIRLHAEGEADGQDQPPFRRAAFLEAPAIAPLAPAYNFRTPFPGLIRGGVKILHGRGSYVQRLATNINTSLKLRAVIPDHSHAVRRTLYGGQRPPKLAQLALKIAFAAHSFGASWSHTQREEDEN